MHLVEERAGLAGPVHQARGDPPPAAAAGAGGAGAGPSRRGSSRRSHSRSRGRGRGPAGGAAGRPAGRAGGGAQRRPPRAAPAVPPAVPRRLAPARAGGACPLWSLGCRLLWRRGRSRRLRLRLCSHLLCSLLLLPLRCCRLRRRGSGRLRRRRGSGRLGSGPHARRQLPRGAGDFGGLEGGELGRRGGELPFGCQSLRGQRRERAQVSLLWDAPNPLASAYAAVCITSRSKGMGTRSRPLGGAGKELQGAPGAAFPRSSCRAAPSRILLLSS